MVLGITSIACVVGRRDDDEQHGSERAHTNQREQSRPGDTVSLYMLAMPGGISIGALLTGAAVSLVGVQRTLLFNGVVAILLQTAFARAWLQAPMPSNCGEN